MVSIILALCVPVTAFIGCKFTLKAYENGLKHNYELKNNEKPSKEKSTIEKIYETKEDAKERKEQEQQFQDIINEYLGN